MLLWLSDMLIFLFISRKFLKWFLYVLSNTVI